MKFLISLFDSEIKGLVVYKVFRSLQLRRAMSSVPGSVRWMLNYSNWNPSPEQWSTACQFVESEEIARIHRFVYQRDAKAAMVGRIMIRGFFAEVKLHNFSPRSSQKLIIAFRRSRKLETQVLNLDGRKKENHF